MYKPGLVEPDIDKSRLHTGKHTHHLAFIDIANRPTAQGALNADFLQYAIFHERYP